MISPRLWWVGARPRTLAAAVVPVAVGGVSAARLSSGTVDLALVGLALVVSVALQVGVNYANDYSDGIRGTDRDRVGPLRLVGSGTASARSVKWAAFIAFGIAALAGLVIAGYTSWWLVLVGLFSIAAGWFYTGGPHPYGYAGLGEVFVFIFFGVVATMGTAYAASSELLVWTVLPGSAVGILAVQLLVVNNLRDIPSDRESGKRTLAVRLGDGSTRVMYMLLALAFFVLVLVMAVRFRGATLALLAVPLAWKPIRDLRRGVVGGALVGVLASTALVQLAAGLLLAAGLFLS